MEQWKPFFRFETQEACESLRSELVRRESNPPRREAARAHMAEKDPKYRQKTPVHVRVLDYLWFCGRDAWQPLDFFGHTRCAYRETGRSANAVSTLHRRRPAAHGDGPEGED